MTPEEFIDENYFSLTIDCKREINEIYQALKDYAKIEQLTLTDVSQHRELLIDFCTKLELKAKQYSYLIPDEDFIDEYLKDN